jgi:DNA-binding XRE family transcriptional regulator
MNKMMKPQTITIKGEELVLLRRVDYEALLARTKVETNEDAGTARIVARSKAALAAGRDVELPAEVAEAIARGENALRVIRTWRGLTQVELGYSKTDIGQSTISALENGTRQGTPAIWKRLAQVLRVPMEVLIPE